jgi:hypothetical protein
METLGRTGQKIEFVAVGHLAVDVRNGRHILGGAAAYGCRAASGLGLATAMVTAVGEDFELFDPLAGIEIYFHRSGTSTSFENLYYKEERKQRLLGLAHPLVEKDLAVLDGRLAEDAVVLYCPLAGEVKAPFRRLAEQGRCGVAPQGLFRRWDADGTIHSATWEEAPRQLADADFVSLSRSDPPDLEAFVRGVAGRIPVLAVTEGDRGARIYAGSRIYHVPAFRREPVDPTGAGDVFAACFLIALRKGKDFLDAAQFACCAASFAVEQEGVGEVPDVWRNIEDRLEIYRKRFETKEL